MLLISKLFFFILLSAIFFFEGLGLVDRQFALYTVYLTPLFLFFPLVLVGRQIVFPKNLTRLFLFFFLFSTISLFFSVNIERSLYFFVYYLSVFLIFIFVYNFKKELIKGVVVLAFLLTAIFLIYSLFLLLPVSKEFSFLVPKRDYQFIYQVYPTHHPLGIFLIIPLSFVLAAFMDKGKKLYLLTFMLLLGILFLTYFRSSYVAFIAASCFLLFIKLREKKEYLSLRSVFIVTLIILAALFVFVVTFYQKPLFILGDIHQFLRTNLNLGYKSFLSARDEYWLEAIRGFAERPFFGVGLGNFWNLSLRFVTSGAFADSANLFLDFFAELGIFGGFVFLFIVLKIFLTGKEALKENELLSKMIFIGFFSLIVLFQAGPGKHYSLILFFFILGALLYSEKDELVNAGWLSLLLSAAVVFFAQSIFMSRLYLKSGYSLFAFYRFPFQKAVYGLLIKGLEEKRERGKIDAFLGVYGRLFSGEIDVLNYLAGVYEKRGDKKIALDFYERSFTWYRFQSFSLVEKIYALKKEVVGKEEAERFVQKFLSEYYYLYHKYYWPNFKAEIDRFCKKEKAVCTL